MKRSFEKRVGVHLADLRLAAKPGLESASALGFASVVLDTSHGELSPQSLTHSGRRHLVRYARGLNIRISGLERQTTEPWFANHSLLDWHINETRSLIDLAADLDTKLICLSIGRIDHLIESQLDTVCDALDKVVVHADRTNCTIAIELGSNLPSTLETVIRTLNCDCLAVNYDPAARIMCGHDPLEPIETLAGRLGLCQLRDADVGSVSMPGQETNLGQGQLNLRSYLASLDDAGFSGDLIINRRFSDRPIEDIATCKQHLCEIT